MPQINDTPGAGSGRIQSRTPEQKEIVNGELQLEACVAVWAEEVELADNPDYSVTDASVESGVCTLTIELEVEGTPLRGTWNGSIVSRDGTLQITADGQPQPIVTASQLANALK